MRRQYWMHLAVFGLLCILPHIAHGAGTGFFGPIIPDAAGNDICNCATSAPDWGCVLQVFQNVLSAVVSISLVLMSLFIAYAGFRFILSPANEEQRLKARQTLTNAILGMLIILASWLIVDSVMKVLYRGSNGDTGFGPWNTILDTTKPSPCIYQHAAPTKLPDIGSGGGSNAGGGGAGNLTPTQNSLGSCKAASLQDVFGTKAPAMSCVTHYENGSCNLRAPSGTDIGADGNVVSFGMFQINISANDLDSYPACKAAVNNQSLNCTKAFTGGAYTGSNHNTRVSDQTLYARCKAATYDEGCNKQAAKHILDTQGIGAWGTAAQGACRSLL
jgi:hypothetical protein